MPHKLRCAVIGTGNMGKNHARVYSEIPDVELVCIAETDEKSGKATAGQYDIKYYPDYEEMLKRENLDIVSVCVPTSLHFKVASHCLKKHVNVLLEKPIATSLQEGRKLLATAKKNKVRLFVGHIERFNPAVKKVKEIIKKGEIGKVIAIIARRVGGFPAQIKDVNIAVDLAIHDIDIINYLLNDRPKKVYANKKRNHTKKREDSVEFFMKYENDVSAYIQANWITPAKIRKLNITGSEGYLEMDYITQKIQFFKSNYKKYHETSMGYSDFVLRFSEPDIIDIAVAKKEPLREEILYFIDSVMHRRKVDSRFAVDSLRIALLTAHKK